MALKDIGTWRFNAMGGSTWVQLVVSVTEDTIKYQTGPYTTQEIKLKHSVKDHIPLINKYASYVRLNEYRNAGNGNYIGDTGKCMMDLVEFISMLGEISSKTSMLSIEKEEVSKENQELREEKEETIKEIQKLREEKEKLWKQNQELRKENELLKEYKQKKD